MAKQEFIWTLEKDRKLRASRIREYIICPSTRTSGKFLVMAWLTESDGHAVAECDTREDAQIWIDQNT